MLHRKGMVSLTDHGKVKAFLGINYLMGINKPPSVAIYWEVDDYIDIAMVSRHSSKSSQCKQWG